MIPDKNKCYHCGNLPIGSPVEYDNKLFCCTGCESVYKLLEGNGLEDFYKINSSPGSRPSSNSREKYLYLDSEEISARFYLFNEGEIRKISVLLPSIHCSSCIWILENLYQLNDGISGSEVNFTSKKALITFNNSKIKLSELAFLLDSIGYTPVFDAQQDTQSKKYDKTLLLQLAVAGFCFGNIMLLSFPEYLNVDNTFIKEFRNFFAYVIFFLSLPILFFSAQSYIISAFKSIRSQQVNLDIPITVGIIALYSKSVFDIFTNNGPGYMDSFSGFVFFLLIGKWFQSKTYESLSFERNYKSYFPLAVTIVSNDQEKILPIEKLEIGDEFLIKNEDIIPTDSVLIKGSTSIDYSFVTGESTRIGKELNDRIFAGGKHFGETIVLKAVKKVDQSYLTSLWNQDAFKEDNSRNISTYTTNISRVFIIVVLVLSLLTSLVWFFIDSSKVVNVLVSVLIVACPCALALSVPFTFGHIMRMFGKNQLYLKNTNVVERMASVTDIIFDKTGTITKVGESSLTYLGEDLNEFDKAVFYSLSYQSSHPLSRLITNYWSKEINSRIEFENFKSISGSGMEGIYKGNHYKLGSSTYVEYISSDKDIATKVYLKKDNKVLGYFLFSNVYREGLLDLVIKLKENYKLHILSGDNASEKDNLESIFGKGVDLNFNQQPIDKLNYIQNLKNKGKNVLMFGDGLNDSGALKQSDVGIVLSDDVFNFSPASDGILNAKSFLKIPKFLFLSNYGIKVLKFSYMFSLCYNITGFVFAATNMLTPLIAAIIMPLSSITIVTFTTLSIKLKESYLNN